MGIFGNKKSEKSEPPARLFLGTSGELAAIGKAGFGVAGGSFPGISLVDMDRFVVPAYEQAGYPELGTPEFFNFQSSFMRKHDFAQTVLNSVLGPSRRIESDRALESIWTW